MTKAGDMEDRNDVRPGEAAAKFRALHETFFVMPNPWDGASARLVAAKGFGAVATSSAALAWTLGRPDGGVTRDEAIAHAAMLARWTGLPVNGDFESGYGETAAEVGETVRAAIDAGVAGASIEDLARDGREPLYSLDEACRRLEAAREAIEQSGSDFVLTGRCEAFLAGVPEPLAETRTRLAAYAAMADVIYAPGLRTEAEVGEIVALTDKPVNVIAGLGGVSDDLPALERLGVKRVSLGSGLFKVAYGALIAAAEGLVEGRVLKEGATSSRVVNEAVAKA